MEKLKSTRLGGIEFYRDPIRTEPVDGLPCFSFEEIRLLKTLNLKDDEFRWLFETKREPGSRISPPSESLHLAARPAEKETLHTPKGTHSSYERAKEANIAKFWAQKIQAEIVSKNPRTVTSNVERREARDTPPIEQASLPGTEDKR